MKKSFHTFVTILAASIAAVLAVDSAKAGVVYGNLGPSGTNAIQATGGVALTSSQWRAIGFTAGGTDLVLDTVTIGLNVNSSGSAVVRLDLYDNNSGVPGTSLFNTSLTLAANTLNAPISFLLNQTLTSGSTYWIVAQKTGGAGTLGWRPADGSPAPTTQNASGWTNLGNATGITSTNAGGTWGSTGNGSSSSISLFASPVPEPSTFVMLLMASSGALLWARRKKRI